MSLKTLDDLFVHELKDTMHAERELLRFHPKMPTATESESMGAAFEDRREQAEQQFERVAKVFDMMEKALQANR